LGLAAGLNSLLDISTLPQFGGICGFTEPELEPRFAREIEETAQVLQISPEKRLDKTRDYSGGFSFDGVTRVYNPYSVFQFFQNKQFRPFWFEKENSAHWAQYSREKRLTVEEFRGSRVSGDFFRDPGEIALTGPWSPLYQMGCLSPGQSENSNSYTLDYPNYEILKSMSLLWLENFFGSKELTLALAQDLSLALESRNLNWVIQFFNQVLSAIPYDDYPEVGRQTLWPISEVDYGEFLGRATIGTFLTLTDRRTAATIKVDRGRLDLVVTTNEGRSG
jgi:hypothetical protein